MMQISVQKGTMLRSSFKDRRISIRVQKCCDYLKNGKKRYRQFTNGYLRRHQAREIVYRKKNNNHRVTFDYPFPILGSALERA